MTLFLVKKSGKMWLLRQKVWNFHQLYKPVAALCISEVWSIWKVHTVDILNIEVYFFHLMMLHEVIVHWNSKFWSIFLNFWYFSNPPIFATSLSWTLKISHITHTIGGNKISKNQPILLKSLPHFPDIVRFLQTMVLKND